MTPTLVNPKSQNVIRPRFETVKLADGLKWQGGSNYIYQEKKDGIWYPLELGPTIRKDEFHESQINSHSPTPSRSTLILGERLQALTDTWPEIAHGVEAFNLKPSTLNNSSSGGDLLRTILSAGGEGIVAKPLDAPYGATWYKCKRTQTFDLIVAQKDPSGKASIRLQDPHGENFGWCPCRAAFDTLQIGDTVEIEAYARTRNGHLREPRFIRTRPDKGVANLTIVH